jgi:hypothetical protein
LSSNLVGHLVASIALLTAVWALEMWHEYSSID